MCHKDNHGPHGFFQSHPDSPKPQGTKIALAFACAAVGHGVILLIQRTGPEKSIVFLGGFLQHPATGAKGY